MSTANVPYKFLGPPPAVARGSITSSVTDVLRNAIVTLALKPGETLDKGAICTRLKVSRFPVSEALSRLQSEGLVDIQPQRGSTVSLVKIADVLEFMTIRRALECEAVSLLVADLPPHLLAALDASLDQQRVAVAKDDPADFHQRDLEFHDLLLGALRFARVKAIIDGARANLDRARRLILTPRRTAASLSEHEAIVDAIRRGNAADATTLMRQHISSVIDELLEFARNRGELFADGDTFATPSL